MMMRVLFGSLMLLCIAMGVHGVSLNPLRMGPKLSVVFAGDDAADAETASGGELETTETDCIDRLFECQVQTGFTACNAGDEGCCDRAGRFIDCMEGYTDDCPREYDDFVSEYNSQCGGCFSARSNVRLDDGSVKTMEELQVGDRVQTGEHSFSEVFSFGHRDPSAVSAFLRIRAGANQIEVTPGHYLMAKATLVAADSVQVGDVLDLGEGGAAEVTSIETFKGTGLYNPHTLDGQIVVDGVMASIYTRAVPPALARVLLAVPKMLYRLGMGDVIGSYLHGASPSIARLIPRGSAKADL